MSSAIVINDVPELKNEKTVSTIVNLSWYVSTTHRLEECSNPYIISASQVKKEIRKRLELDVKQEKRKYDIIFLCESGGTILCERFEGILHEFGHKTKILPYSLHTETGRARKDWINSCYMTAHMAPAFCLAL